MTTQMIMGIDPKVDGSIRNKKAGSFVNLPLLFEKGSSII